MEQLDAIFIGIIVLYLFACVGAIAAFVASARHFEDKHS
jgi:hypothetical protein